MRIFSSKGRREPKREKEDVQENIDPNLKEYNEKKS